MRLFKNALTLLALASATGFAADYSMPITPVLSSAGTLNFGFIETAFTFTPARRSVGWRGSVKIKYSHDAATPSDFAGTVANLDFKRPSKDGRSWVLDVTYTHPKFSKVLVSGRSFITGSFTAELVSCDGQNVQKRFDYNRPLPEIVADFEEFDFTNFKSCRLDVTQGYVPDAVNSDYTFADRYDNTILLLRPLASGQDSSFSNSLEVLSDGSIIQTSGSGVSNSSAQLLYKPVLTVTDAGSRTMALSAASEFVRLIKDHGRTLVYISTTPNLPEAQRRNLIVASLESRRPQILAQLNLLKSRFAALTISDKISAAVAIRDAYAFVAYLETQVSALPDCRVNLDREISEFWN